jgi:HEAT repeats
MIEDFALDVENLAVKHRARAALKSLMDGGPAAGPFVRQGLHHQNSAVIVGCCRVLDHFLYEEAVPDLLALLDHDDEDVRAWAMHALACDRCKEGTCRPGEDDSIPMALSMLRSDPSSKVRVQTVALIFPAVHHRADVAEALKHARDHDPSPNVRKQAGLRAPGGSMYLRKSPLREERIALRSSSTRARLIAR